MKIFYRFVIFVFVVMNDSSPLFCAQNSIVKSDEKKIIVLDSEEKEFSEENYHLNVQDQALEDQQALFEAKYMQSKQESFSDEEVTPWRCGIFEDKIINIGLEERGNVSIFVEGKQGEGYEWYSYFLKVPTTATFDQLQEDLKKLAYTNAKIQLWVKYPFHPQLIPINNMRDFVRIGIVNRAFVEFTEDWQ